MAFSNLFYTFRTPNAKQQTPPRAKLADGGRFHLRQNRKFHTSLNYLPLIPDLVSSQGLKQSKLFHSIHLVTSNLFVLGRCVIQLAFQGLQYLEYQIDQN